ncbi:MULTISPECIES: hypothetical protein [unclassified Spiroplasma]
MGCRLDQLFLSIFEEPINFVDTLIFFRWIVAPWPPAATTELFKLI